MQTKEMFKARNTCVKKCILYNIYLVSAWQGDTKKLIMIM